MKKKNAKQIVEGLGKGKIPSCNAIMDNYYIPTGSLMHDKAVEDFMDYSNFKNEILGRILIWNEGIKAMTNIECIFENDNGIEIDHNEIIPESDGMKITISFIFWLKDGDKSIKIQLIYLEGRLQSDHVKASWIPHASPALIFKTPEQHFTFMGLLLKRNPKLRTAYLD